MTKTGKISSGQGTWSANLITGVWIPRNTPHNDAGWAGRPHVIPAWAGRDRGSPEQAGKHQTEKLWVWQADTAAMNKVEEWLTVILNGSFQPPLAPIHTSTKSIRVLTHHSYGLNDEYRGTLVCPTALLFFTLYHLFIKTSGPTGQQQAKLMPTPDVHHGFIRTETTQRQHLVQKAQKAACISHKSSAKSNRSIHSSASDSD